MATRVERIERVAVAVERVTDRRVTPVALVVIILKNLVVVVSVRVVVVDGTAAGWQIVFRNFVGADPDETAEFRDCKGVVSSSLEEWMSIECGAVAHRRVCEERILRGVAALDAVEEREEDGIVRVGECIQLVNLCKLLSSDRSNGRMRSRPREEDRKRLQEARRVREAIDAAGVGSRRVRGWSGSHAQRRRRR